MFRKAPALQERGLAVQTSSVSTLDAWHKLLSLSLAACQTLVSQDFNGPEEQSFRPSDRLELYIGCSFMLHLVAFALPELFPWVVLP